MKKVCTGCGEERDAEKDFNWKYKDRGIRHTRCKLCTAQVSKQHYRDNKQSYLIRIRKNEVQVIEVNQKRVAAYLSSHPCVNCGCSDVRVLEFDHIRGQKSGNIARMIGDGYSWATIEAEIAKCEVKCANCHRIKTGEEGGSWRHFSEDIIERTLERSHVPHAYIKASNRQKIYNYLSVHPCVDCGCTDIRCLEFDHVRGKKSESITRLLDGGASWKRIETEIAKCEVRCANCHRIKTLERGRWWRSELVQ